MAAGRANPLLRQPFISESAELAPPKRTERACATRLRVPQQRFRAASAACASGRVNACLAVMAPSTSSSGSYLIRPRKHVRGEPGAAGTGAAEEGALACRAREAAALHLPEKSSATSACRPRPRAQTLSTAPRSARARGRGRAGARARLARLERRVAPRHDVLPPLGQAAPCTRKVDLPPRRRRKQAPCGCTPACPRPGGRAPR